ncbi:hypothetical protein A4A49_37160 [Nicotiana attenuata]|uniref:Uncharacterized protein n=1 Tax=Nicotiana attenuata TaxID=49451 RepID=A0A314LF49_NICAT|nr:hypothetical protein A4A49_37160 [Nicotiana attenuata]
MAYDDWNLNRVRQRTSDSDLERTQIQTSKLIGVGDVTATTMATLLVLNPSDIEVKISVAAVLIQRSSSSSNGFLGVGGRE